MIACNVNNVCVCVCDFVAGSFINNLECKNFIFTKLKTKCNIIFSDQSTCNYTFFTVNSEKSVIASYIFI